MRVAVIRVSFQEDSSPATTGNGQFVLADTNAITCDQWTLDPPPHDKFYFKDHLEAANNYWQKVSSGNVGVDTMLSTIYPVGRDASYLLPHDMLYYHPYLESYDETEKLFELSRDALALADPDVDFNLYSTIMLVHAGMGGDFAFALDPTPGNIPSAYLSQQDFSEYGTLETTEGPLTDLIIIPESQNFLQYAETRSLFEDATDPCFYQVGLNGTVALMLGFHLGLPPLYNTDSGVSLVGGFALMDQGSNNFHGVVPAYPDPYTRMEMGWTNAQQAHVGDDITLGIHDPPIQVNMSDREYYLIENRQRNMDSLIHVPQWIDEAGFDTVSVILSDRGVVLDVDEQHAGLPGNGLYIWHIDESAWFSAENPNGGLNQLVDFVEADGAQDMGFTTQLLFADYLETGWWFDPWFAANAGYFDLNRSTSVPADSLLSFGPNTRPSTVSNSGNPSHLLIDNISRNGSVMSFSIRSERMVNTEVISAFLGWSETGNEIWALNQDSTEINSYTLSEGDLQIVTGSPISPEYILEPEFKESVVFRAPWIGRNFENGLMFKNILTNIDYFQVGKSNPFELSVQSSRIWYFAENDENYTFGNWNSTLGTSTFTILPSFPSARFQTLSGISFQYDATQEEPKPVGVRNVDPDFIEGSIPSELSMISWSTSNNQLELTTLPESTTKGIVVEQPLHIIPLDADADGDYEIALFYATEIKIINQQGTAWNGSPFTVDAYLGNPLIGPMVKGELGIFLRHAQSYSIYSVSGKLEETGVLDTVPAEAQNTLRLQNNGSLVLSASQMLQFSFEDPHSNRLFWSDPQGNSAGTRIVNIFQTAVNNHPELKAGSVYNYPNPIKGSKTTIRAWIGAVDTWQIDIYSLSGAKVLHHELDVDQHNSYNEWVWDASSLSNGVFLGQVTAGDRSEIIKIAIIR